MQHQEAAREGHRTERTQMDVMALPQGPWRGRGRGEGQRLEEEGEGEWRAGRTEGRRVAAERGGDGGRAASPSLRSVLSLRIPRAAALTVITKYATHTTLSTTVAREADGVYMVN